MEEFDFQHMPEEHVLKRQNPEWRRFFRMHPTLKRWLPVVGVSVLSSLAVVAVAGALLWRFRAPIARSLLATVPATAPLAAAPTAALPTEGGSVAAVVPQDLSVTDVVAKANPSVVSIEVSQTVSTVNPFEQFFPGMFQTPSEPQTKVIGGGSGFFVSSNGLVVTNRHVVDFSNATFSVITSSGKRYSATVLAKDPVLDIAMLQVKGSGFTPATLGNSDNLALGQSVVAIGYALGEFKNSISTGVISGLSRSITAGGGGSVEQLDRVIQTDAAINPGNSGGPLLNLRGEVIGVNVAMAQGSQNVGFALPINSVKTAIDSVKQSGTIIRPYVGIQYTQINAAVQTQLHLPFDYGIIIQDVVSGSPAASAGLRQGDIVLSAAGTKLDGNRTFAAIVREQSVGDTMSLQVYSGGVMKTVRVKLGKAPTL